jgi:hypothetical protein
MVWKESAMMVPPLKRAIAGGREQEANRFWEGSLTCMEGQAGEP